MDDASKGAELLEANKPLEAAAAYTRALSEDPTSPDYYTQRSIAFTRLAKHDFALEDAEKAVLCGHKRSKRASIQLAQHRRAVALYNLGQYGNAKFILEKMKPWVSEEDKKGMMQINMWMAKTDSKLKIATEEQKTITIEEKPNTAVPSDTKNKYTFLRQLNNDGTYNFNWQNEEDKAPQPTTPIQSTPSAAPTTTTSTTSAATGKIRHEWYQNAQSVIITFYAKGIPKDKADVDIQNHLVSVAFPHPADPTSEVSFSFDPLFALVDASGSSFRVLSTKLELTLKKAVVGQKWHNLEGTEPLDISTNITDTAVKSAVPSTVRPSTTASGPVYPTSSKSGPKDWDKVAAEFTKDKSTKAKDEDEDDSGDEVKVESDDEGGDAVDSFFKKLYKDADPDTRRAMMKSFQESNGTALSTNWDEVGKKRVDPVESKSD